MIEREMWLREQNRLNDSEMGQYQHEASQLERMQLLQNYRAQQNHLPFYDEGGDDDYDFDMSVPEYEREGPEIVMDEHKSEDNTNEIQQRDVERQNLQDDGEQEQNSSSEIQIGTQFAQVV